VSPRSNGTKWLEALKQIAPRVTRVALIYNPETAPYADLFQRPVEAAAPAFAVMPITVAARSAAELESAVDAFARTPMSLDRSIPWTGRRCCSVLVAGSIAQSTG
jgi:ABC-type uncharacterized transport system substrate-binding protein